MPLFKHSLVLLFMISVFQIVYTSQAISEIGSDVQIEPLESSKYQSNPQSTVTNPNQNKIKPSSSCPSGRYCLKLTKSFNVNCKSFISNTGSWTNESLGLEMLTAMDEVMKAHKNDDPDQITANCSFYEDINFGASCPNFKSLSFSQKQHVYVWLWAAMAQSHSNCDLNKDVEVHENISLGRTELTDGLFGLEFHYDTRQSNGRDSRFCPHESIADTKNIFFQTRCSASILFDQSCRQPSLFQTTSFFKSITTSDGLVSQLLQNHPLCKTTSELLSFKN